MSGSGCCDDHVRSAIAVTLLGSGAADGWPNPFCGCASCRAAQGEGRGRAQTSALVGGRLLLDCGSDVPRSAARLGESLADVRHLLVTHAHPDHLGAAALLFRHWAERTEPLDVVGPADVIAECRQWVAPDDPVRFVEVAAGDEVMLGEPDDAGPVFRVRVLAANHRVLSDGDAVLYDVEAVRDGGSAARDGGSGRVLWATDTGPLPEATLDAVAGLEFDAVFLEETFGDRTDLGDQHLNLTTFPRAVAALRDRGAVVDGTRLVAVHMSHHNPPPAELEARLARWGAAIGEDGMSLLLPESAGRAIASEPERPGRALIVGGARSGKSALAEQMLADRSDVTYIATGGVGREDVEWLERVAAHRARRPGSWRTVETLDAAAQLQAAASPVLLDCLGTWLTGRFDRRGAWNDASGAATASVEADIAELVAAWRACGQPVVAVSNEVGSGVVPETASGRLFRDLLGRLNAAVAAQSDEVVLTVAGLPVRLR